MDKPNAAVIEQPKTEVVAEEPKSLSAKEILARIEPKAAAPSEVTIDDLKSVKFDDIKDPVARALAEKRVKELESGFNKKYEQVANLRKSLEEKAQQGNAPRQWTQQELDAALKDPQFISLVQARQQSVSANQPPAAFDGTSEEWSALTPQEKQAVVSAQSTAQSALDEVSALKYQLSRTEEDSKLKQSYPDYDPGVVDRIQQDLATGRLQATREHLWKVANFESAVERAYNLGLQQKKLDLTDKLNASSGLQNMNVTPSGEVPEEIKKKGFGAIGRWRLEQLRKK